MNPNIFTELKKDSSYSLTASERASMRTALVHHMHNNPVRGVSWLVFISRPMHITAVILMVCISSGSVSFAAGNALPGEALYGVKVGMNERIELAFAPSPDAKAQVRVRHIEERLREVEVLAVEGALTDSFARKATQSIAEHASAVRDTAKELALEGDTFGAEGLGIRIDATLVAHGELLEAHAENFEDEQREALLAVRDVVREVEQEGLETAIPQTLNSETVYTDVAYARVVEHLSTLERRLEKEPLAKETQEEFINELARLRTELEFGEVSLAEGDVVQTRALYERIEKDAYRALTLLASAKNIAEETDKEVVIVLVSGTDGFASSAVAARMSKAGDEEGVTAMRMTAPPVDESMNISFMSSESVPEPQSKLEFRIREAE